MWWKEKYVGGKGGVCRMFQSGREEMYVLRSERPVGDWELQLHLTVGVEKDEDILGKENC